MTKSYNEYVEMKQKFMKKHNNDWKVDTSSMNEYGVYYKTYVFADGAVWYERMSPAYREKEISFEIEGLTFTQKVEVKLFETEFFNSDNAESHKYYEKW